MNVNANRALSDVIGRRHLYTISRDIEMEGLYDFDGELSIDDLHEESDRILFKELSLNIPQQQACPKCLKVS